MNDGSIQFWGLPDGQTPFACLRVGYQVNFSGSVLTIVSLNGANVPPTTGQYQFGIYLENTVSFSDSSVQTVMSILQQAGNPASGVVIIGTTQADLSQTQ